MRIEAKLIGCLDECTYIPLLCFRIHEDELTPRELRIMKRTGYGTPSNYTWFYDMNAGQCTYDPYKLRDHRTLTTAALYIRDHWEEFEDADVLDTQVIRGETTVAKQWKDEFDD